MIIREVQKCDCNDLTYLLDDSFGGDCVYNFEKFEKWIMTPNQYTFVGFMDNELVATHTVTIEHKFTHSYGKVAHMEDLAVLEKRRKEGLAKRMLEYSLEFCKQKGVYKILATCDKDMVEYYCKIIGFKEHEISLRGDC